jgi:hypothetical protein
MDPQDRFDGKSSDSEESESETKNAIKIEEDITDTAALDGEDHTETTVASPTPIDSEPDYVSDKGSESYSEILPNDISFNIASPSMPSTSQPSEAMQYGSPPGLLDRGSPSDDEPVMKSAPGYKRKLVDMMMAGRAKLAEKIPGKFKSNESSGEDEEVVEVKRAKKFHGESKSKSRFKLSLWKGFGDAGDGFNLKSGKLYDPKEWKESDW